MISIQTNYASMVGEQNLATNNTFQTKTIEALTSGYRINSSGDDPAGLAVANQFRSNVTELTQGVINGNSGVATLQIIDGGLSNISTMLDRMKTLATESASGTFTGDRSTLDQEFQSLKTEITRQATNIGLISGGANATNLSVYIGGSPTGGSLSSAAVSVDLSAGLVDAGGLGLTNAAVGNGGSGTSLTAAPDVSGNNPITLAPTTFNVYTVATSSAGKTVTLSGIATGTQLVSDINNQLAGTGLTADINSSTGKVEFQGGAFELDGSTGDFAKIIGTGTASSGSMYQGSVAGAAAASTASQDLTFTVDGTNTKVTLQSGLTVQQEVDAINQQMNAQGVYAVFDSTAGEVNFSGTSPFEVAAAATTGGAFAAGLAVDGTGAPANGAPGIATQNATAAIASVNDALALLGKVQGTVGAGENDLQYAINLANSQITNFSTAESQIRDADIATEAANLTKAQVMQQASVAAMAQANAAPQAVLKLLQ
jgi:flagellin